MDTKAAGKIRKNYTLEPKTVSIIKQLAKKEKRNFNTVVDILIQEAASQRGIVVDSQS